VLEFDFCLLERGGRLATLNETAEMDDFGKGSGGLGGDARPVVEIVQLDTDDSGHPSACSASESDSDEVLAGGPG
jgi:hypothetical protein